MPIDFTPTSIVKSAKRTFTAPITAAAAFDEAVAALKAADNPLGATSYQTAGETIDGVTTANEYYKATIEYVNPLGDTLGTIVIDAPTRDAYDTIIAELLATTAITTAYAADASPSRNTAKDTWSVPSKSTTPPVKSTTSASPERISRSAPTRATPSSPRLTPGPTRSRFSTDRPC